MKFHVGFHDRGHGHGDYAVLNEKDEVIAKVETGMLDDAHLLSASPSLLEGCKKALTCASIDSDVRAVIQSAIVEAKGGT